MPTAPRGRHDRRPSENENAMFFCITVNFGSQICDVSNFLCCNFRYVTFAKSILSLHLKTVFPFINYCAFQVAAPLIGASHGLLGLRVMSAMENLFTQCETFYCFPFSSLPIETEI